VVHFEFLKGVLWFCYVCNILVDDIAFARFTGMAPPGPAGGNIARV
jgi:hypothetical protein